MFIAGSPPLSLVIAYPLVGLGDAKGLAGRRDRRRRSGDASLLTATLAATGQRHPTDDPGAEPFYH